MKEYFKMVKLNLFCISVLCCSIVVCSGQSSSETVNIPSQLLNQLIRDDAEIRTVLLDGYDPVNNPNQQFFVELADLNNDKKPEYFVSQTGGNSSAPPWIYRRTRNGYQQILKAAFMKFRVPQSSANGYHDLELSYGGNAMGMKAIPSYSMGVNTSLGQTRSQGSSLTEQANQAIGEKQ